MVPGSFLKVGDLGWPDPHPVTEVALSKLLSPFGTRVFLCFIKPILGNRYGPGVIP